MSDKTSSKRKIDEAEAKRQTSNKKIGMNLSPIILEQQDDEYYSELFAELRSDEFVDVVNSPVDKRRDDVSASAMTHSAEEIDLVTSIIAANHHRPVAVSDSGGACVVSEYNEDEHLRELETELSQIDDSTHPKLNEQLDELRDEHDRRLQQISIHKELALERIEKEYQRDLRELDDDIEKEKELLKQKLILQLEEEKWLLRTEKRMRLRQEHLESATSAAFQRQMLQRGTTERDSPKDVRLEVNYLLSESEILEDLAAIARAQ